MSHSPPCLRESTADKLEWRRVLWVNIFAGSYASNFQQKIYYIHGRHLRGRPQGDWLSIIKWRGTFYVAKGKRGVTYGDVKLIS